MTEEWRDVAGYEGLYQVSNCGHVRSLDRTCGIKPCKGQMLKPSISFGYARVALWKNGLSQKYFVHRLVAESFISNPDNHNFINHKDENKQNNDVGNLEWCTQLYNIHYGTRSQKVSEKTRGENHYFSKLKEEDAIYIRNHYKPRDAKCGGAALARKYNVSVGAVKAIVEGRTWKYLIKEEIA